MRIRDWSSDVCSSDLKDEFVVTEAARGINDDRFIKEALPALSKVLTEDRFTDEALIRRAINACLWTGAEETMRYLVNYAMKEDRPVAMQIGRAPCMERVGYDE